MQLPWFSALCVASCLVGGTYIASANADVSTYSSYAAFGPPGVYLPSGPDAIGKVILTCPSTPKTTGLLIVLPSGASESRYVIPNFEGPIHHRISLSFTQGHAVRARTVLFRLRVGNGAVDGKLPLPGNATGLLPAPGCQGGWAYRVRLLRIPQLYKPGTLPSMPAYEVPFPYER